MSADPMTLAGPLRALTAEMIRNIEFIGPTVEDGSIRVDGQLMPLVRPEKSSERAQRIADEVVPMIDDLVRHQIIYRLQVMRNLASEMFDDPGGVDLPHMEAFTDAVDFAIRLCHDDPGEGS